MSWDNKNREAYAQKTCRLWCADVLAVPEDELKISPRRARHKRDHSIFVVNVSKSGEVPRKFSFVVPFVSDDSSPSFSRVEEYDEASGLWQTVFDISAQDDTPETKEPANSRFFRSTVTWLLLGISVLVFLYSGAAVIKRIASMAEGISAYTWSTADGVRYCVRALSEACCASSSRSSRCPSRWRNSSPSSIPSASICKRRPRPT